MAERLYGRGPERARQKVRRRVLRRTARSAGAGPAGQTVGFGNFDLRRKNQRPGRKTGEEIPISARTVVTFRPGRS